MLPHLRQKKILDLVHEHKTCTIEELRQQLGVSQVTLYRDLKELGQQKVIRRVHGGIVVQESRKLESRFSVRLESHLQEKERIAKAMAGWVDEGWVIFLDASTTCYIFARELAARQLSRLTVVTNSPLILLEFEAYPHIRVISTGGELLHEINALVGPLAIELLSELHFDATFVSCAGISPSQGAMTDSPLLAEILRKAASNSRLVYLLADGSKFKRQAMLTSLKLEDLDHIMTDSNAPEDAIRDLKDRGVAVTVI
ncbi:MAG: DeoR/GlpR family DNA-binding transcription regulator [Acidobacteria bacterium]|nr:DeoR/GlpR family DNA-binding transcription regulator [Acidobacteriota bacterium]